MATRSTIKVEWINYTKIYKHWDWYPEEMENNLKEFNSTFKEKRWDDPEYKIAQLLIRVRDIWWFDKERFTWWGLLPIDADAWEEYEYTLHADGSVTFKEV